MIHKLHIEGLQDILNHFRPKAIHPLSVEYETFYEELKEKFINGIWVTQKGGYRYVPGRIGWYGVMARFEDWDKKNKVRIAATPKVRDLEWHFAYHIMEAEGFSGFSNDTEYSCDRILLKEEKNFIEDYRLQAITKPNGEFKTYVSAREYLFGLHDENKGHPLYYNEAKNYMLFGTRGGGKSFFTALGVTLYDIVFDGLKYYKAFEYHHTKSEIELCAGQEKKYLEHAEKLEYGMEQLRKNPELGVWGDPSDPTDESYEPSYFYKRMTGKLEPNKVWINKYDGELEGRLIKDAGTHSSVRSVLYSMNDPGSAQKSAGGRRTKVIYEETGLIKYVVDAWGSNDGMVKADQEQIGVQIFIGTSGNMSLVAGSKRMFENPQEFNIVAFKYGDKEYGFFLPAWATDMRFKDENGNTNIEAAIKEHKRIYEEKQDHKDPKVFQHHRMNYPMEIPDMWVTEEGSYLPVREAQHRERQLMQDRKYEDMGTPVKLYHREGTQTGIGYDVDLKVRPYYNWPLEERDTYDPVVMIYHFPKTVNGVIPDDAYIITHDPYVTDEMYKGGSLGVVHVWVSAKYIPQGFEGNCLAATLIGRPTEGLKRFNEILEMLVQFYGNPLHGLWYEANRGSDVRSHFLLKNKFNVLCLQPQFTQGQFIFAKQVNRTGFLVGDRTSKIHMLDKFTDWLLSETELRDEDGNVNKLLNIYRIPCIFTIRQIIAYNLEDNFDAISSAIALPLALGEKEHYDMMRRKQTASTFSGLKKRLKQRYAG